MRHLMNIGLALFISSSLYATNYTFTTVDDRNSGANFTGINDAGQIVGNNSLGGFIYSNGSFNYINAGGSFYAGGINNSGVVSGTLTVAAVDMGAIVDHGSVRTFSVPGSLRTLASQINDTGIVQGYYTTSGPGSPFLYTYDGSAVNTLVPPGATFTFPYGINNSGQMVGEYATAANTLVQFFYDGTSFHEINNPNGYFTEITGISNSGIVFGYYYGANGYSDFFYKDGIFSDVSAPGAITGMNDAGVIVGHQGYLVTSYVPGFIGTPTPEPRAEYLFCLGVAGLSFCLKVKARPTPTERRNSVA